MIMMMITITIMMNMVISYSSLCELHLIPFFVWTRLSNKLKLTKLAWDLDMVKQIFVSVQDNTSRPRQHGRHFVDDAFKRIFLNEMKILEILLKFYRSLFLRIQLTISEHWFRLVSLLTHICGTRPQWVNVKCWGVVSLTGNYIQLFLSFWD